MVPQVVGLFVFSAWLGSHVLRQEISPPPVTVTTAAGDHVVLRVTVVDAASPQMAAASALTVTIDGREAQHILITPGTGRTAYEALLGPLQAGEHRVAVAPSPLWTWPPRLTIDRTEVRVASAENAKAGNAVLTYAPTLGIRADTIGTASDLPLLVYVEDQRRDGKGWIRYSAILSNEDGGTPPPALMARWGRTTDIELVYEVELDGTRMVQDRFQGPDHEMRSFGGMREGQHPYLLVATLNNMVIDRGRSLVAIRPVPFLVSLDGRTRESVMDDHKWIYPLMARELVAEKRIGSQIEDPREFLYVEARLTLERAAISAQAGSESNQWSDSSRGRPELAVDRNGWVRIALPASTPATALRWNCRSKPGDSPGNASCLVEWTRAFRLGADYLPGPNLIVPGRANLSVGLSEPIRLGQ
jgi:hypothetical protein